jgi:hypothetical protein
VLVLNEFVASTRTITDGCEDTPPVLDGGECVAIASGQLTVGALVAVGDIALATTPKSIPKEVVQR